MLFLVSSFNIYSNKINLGFLASTPQKCRLAGKGRPVPFQKLTFKLVRHTIEIQAQQFYSQKNSEAGSQ